MTELGSALFMPIEAADMVGSGSCGVPAPFRECRIVDDERHGRAAHGEIGELSVRGPGILQGYYSKPEATATRFDGDWFRTGDLFRQDERGYFYIVGRMKDMIRRTGENIAAREVEAVLNGAARRRRGRGGPGARRARAARRSRPTSSWRRRAHARAGLARAHHRALRQAISRASRCRATSRTATSLPKTPSEQDRQERAGQGVPICASESYDRVEGRWQ